MKEARNIDLPDDMFKPLDNTQYQWNDHEKEICSFVPTVRRHDEAKKLEDFLHFGRRLRLAVFFHRIEKEQTVVEDQIIRQQSDEIELEKPWTPVSTFNPTPGENEVLETFLTELQNYLFDPENYRKVKDNLTQMQRNALRNLSTWNSNPNNDRMFRIQDKGSRLVIEWKDKYCEKMLSYLQDVSIFKEEAENPFEENERK